MQAYHGATGQAESLLRLGQVGEALAALEGVCIDGCRDAAAWRLFAMALHRLGRGEAALHAIGNAVGIEPASREAWRVQATLLFELKRPQAALEACNAALELDRNDAAALFNTARILEELGHFEAALATYERVTHLAPAMLAAQLNRVALLATLQRLDEALHAAREAVAHHPAVAECWHNLGDVLLARDAPSDALAAFDHAISIDGRHVGALLGRAFSLSVLGRLPEARDQFEGARRLDEAGFRGFRSPLVSDHEDPSFALDPRRIYLNTGFQRLIRGDWRALEQYAGTAIDLIDDPGCFSTPLADRSLAHPALVLPLGAKRRHRLARQIATAVMAEAVRPDDPLRSQSARSPRRRTRLRLGYVSPDFRGHPTAYLTRRLYGLHDRSRFEVYAYSLCPPNDSRVRADIVAGCDVFRDAWRLDPASLASLVAYDDIDILVDLGGYTRFSRPELFAARCAPVQANFLVYPGTIGAPFLDYALVDNAVCPPGAEDQWSEKVVRFPVTYFVYDEMSEVASSAKRAAHGLAESDFVFCCFNAPWKISPQMFDIWMRLLARVPRSVLWLFGDDPALQANLRREAEQRGIPGARLVFAGQVAHAEHLARCGLADLVLDTLPCNAHTTAADALWMGVPVLTCAGEEMQSRVAASLLRAVGLDELVTDSPGDYEALAIQLATQPERMAAIKTKLEAGRRTSVLFSTERRVREIEIAYRMMWQRHEAGLPPESFSVTASDMPEARISSSGITRFAHEPSLKLRFQPRS
ncbi:MAG: tetratricopeptide repeat protein [Rhodocyclaceae bacterium]|nr:tetratricopeptide repeat protein [Rhodocyclaceae bacterium]